MGGSPIVLAHAINHAGAGDRGCTTMPKAVPAGQGRFADRLFSISHQPTDQTVRASYGIRRSAHDWRGFLPASGQEPQCAGTRSRMTEVSLRQLVRGMQRRQEFDQMAGVLAVFVNAGAVAMAEDRAANSSRW